MILTNTVKMRWNSRSKKYYESKGYAFTKLNDEFDLKVEDLLPTSHIKILVQCDDCECINEVCYRDYYNRVYQKYFCSSCGKKYKNSSEPKNNNEKHVKKIPSIAEWGMKNICEDFLDKYWDYKKNIIDPWEIPYNSHELVWYKCQKVDYHDSYQTRCSAMCSDSRCPYCGHRKLHIQDSLGQLIIDQFGKNGINLLWSDKNKKSPFEYYRGGSQKVWWKCINGIHEDFQKRIDTIVGVDFRCVFCSAERTHSYLQELVNSYLCEIFGNGDITHENMCSIIVKNPQTGYPMWFDNCVESLKFLVEVHGIQHYQLTGFHYQQAKITNTTPEDRFQYQQWKDQYKKQYALDHGYYYLEIPYTAEAADKYKELIDNKIKEILEEQSS